MRQATCALRARGAGMRHDVIGLEDGGKVNDAFSMSRASSVIKPHINSGVYNIAKG